MKRMNGHILLSCRVGGDWLEKLSSTRALIWRWSKRLASLTSCIGACLLAYMVAYMVDATEMIGNI